LQSCFIDLDILIEIDDYAGGGENFLRKSFLLPLHPLFFQNL